MLETHSLKLSSDDFNYDMTPGFEMGIEKNWHVIDPTQVDKNVELYDSDLNKLYNDDRYGIRIFYKLVLPLSYFSDSGITNNVMLDSDGRFTFDNGLAIGNPTLKMNFGSNIGTKNRGLLISEETFNNNNNYMLPDEWDLNHTYTKRSAFANGTSIANLAVVNGSETYLQQQNTQLVSTSTPDITFATFPYIFASGYNQGAISSININSGNVAYTVTTEGNSMNVPNSNLSSSYGTKKLMPLLFKPFGMSWCSSDTDNNVFGWVYCVLGVKQMMGEATYTVRFIDWDGTILKQQTVQEGTAATPPADPVREGYTFNGWLPTTYTDVLEDQDIYAQYIEDAPTEPLTYVNGDGDITISNIPDVGTGTATLLVTFDKPLSDVTYDEFYVQEFSAGGGTKTNVVVDNNTVQFTDDDISTRDYYAFQLFNEGQRIGHTAWGAGIIPNKIKITLSDGSIKEFDIKHN